jgi:L-asparaginase
MAVVRADTPSVAVFSTGGTIASMGAPEGQGVVPGPSHDLFAPMRRLHPGVDLSFHDLFAKPSPSVTLADVQQIADAINEQFDHGCGGAVVTHGTDTLEETAFALSMLLLTDRPVVVTGAMRSPGEQGADGPANLAASIMVAASPVAAGLGPVVLFGDEIHAPHLVRKIHSSRLHAFTSDPFGPIGHIVEGDVDLQMRSIEWRKPLRLGGPVPAVPVVQVGLDLEPETIDAFAGADIGALVIAGVGGGHVSSRAVDAVARVADRMPVVLTSRVGMGRTLTRSYAYDGSEIDLARQGVINGGRWRPAQARILLQLLLSDGTSRADIADMLAR